MVKTLVTAALPYANGSIHLGHMVEYIQADAYVRFLRSTGENVIFICADDTHGSPIEINARKQGISPEELIKRYYDEHRKDFADFLVSFDNYYTTNSPENKKFSDFFFLKLKEKGHIIQKDVELTYCGKCARFLPDRYVKGRCPKCSAPDQYGDVCEKCHSAYRTTDLIEPYCAVCGSKPARRSSRHYFFRLADFSGRLEQWLKLNGLLQDEARNSVLDWVEKGLEDWDITRDGPYFGFLIPGETDKYYYVWLDAPIGYISSTENLTHDAAAYWQGKDSRIVHFIGKDIIYFHYLFWPAMLMGVDYNLPTAIRTHGFLTVSGEKMSKSRGTFITAREYLNQQEPEFLRFYFAANLGKSMADIDLDFDDFRNKVNSELVDNLANFVYRVLSFVNNNMDSRLGTPAAEKKLTEDLEAKFQEAREHYSSYNLREAVRTILEISSMGNQYFQEKKPWQFIRQDRKKAVAAVTYAANIVRNLSILIAPVLPRFAERVQKQMLLESPSFGDLGFSMKNREIGKARIVFSRMEGQILKARTFPLALKVGSILSAEEHPSADKLYVLQVDLGGEQRQLVAGLRPYYRKEQLVGTHIVVVANLKPAVIRGVASQGMLLAGDDGRGPCFLSLLAQRQGTWFQLKDLPRPLMRLPLRSLAGLGFQCRTEGLCLKACPCGQRRVRCSARFLMAPG